jgi:hypothetical protein
MHSPTPFSGSRNAAVLVFGSQVQSLAEEAIKEIEQTLLDHESRPWILSTLSELPRSLDALGKVFPKIANVIGSEGRQILVDLESWVRGNQNTGADGWPFGNEPIPTVALAPMVILTQIVQYRRFLTLQQRQDEDHQAALIAQGKASTLGFCMGLLSAFAVASSNNQAELDKYGAVEVRLACVGGALIDAQSAWAPTRSFGTAWKGAKQREDMERIVRNLSPDAYISVLYGSARATVTTLERAAARLLRQLRA